MEGPSSSRADEGLSKKCGYYVDGKRRFCRMLVGKGRQHCGVHEHVSQNMVVDAEQSIRRRIPCPLDPTHCCFEHMLQKHMRKCNKRKQALQDYYTPQESIQNEDTDVRRLLISDLTDEQLMRLLDKIVEIYNENVEEIDPKDVEYLANETSNQSNKHDLKHKTQVASIIGHLEKCGLFQPNTCFVEVGAGRGELTAALVQATNGLPKCSYLLIDRACQRHKFDTKLRCEKAAAIRRIRIDIGNLLIDKLDEVGRCENVVILSKHLCGCATDLALQRVAALSDSSVVKSVVIALCCHHRCDWKAYTGWEFLHDCGFQKSEFSVLTAVSSWATCGQMSDNAKQKRCSKQLGHDTEQVNATDEKLDAAYLPQSRYEKLGLTYEKRKVIGLMAKRVIDAGRIHFMQGIGFKFCNLKKYVDDDVTLENVLLVCR